jgi:crossover junction endodeoxyribonuclease RusA
MTLMDAPEWFAAMESALWKDGFRVRNLPWPVSVNDWLGVNRKTGRLFKKTAYREYMQYAALMIRSARPNRWNATGAMGVVITACPKDRSRHRDLDNIQKVLLDASELAGAVDRDDQFDVIVVRRGPVVPGGRVDLTIGRT